ncbi:hypothetical protein ACLKA7_001617 [Drosophila subpalustris]
MTTTTATIINNLTTGEKRANEANKANENETNPRPVTNLTSKLLQATTGNMKSLLSHGMALPTLLLHGVDVGNGQRIKPTSGNISSSSSSNSSSSSDSTTSNITTTSTNIITTATATTTAMSNITLERENLYNAFSSLPSPGNLSGFIESSTTVASNVLGSAITHLPTASGAATTFPTQTIATFIGAGNKNRPTTIILYPTVSPESIVIPIVSCIFGFPILALIVICCLRRRAKLARERDRRRNYDMQDHAVSLVRFSPIHRLNYRSSRAISLRPERSLSQGFTSLELDTVLEERCSDLTAQQQQLQQQQQQQQQQQTPQQQQQLQLESKSTSAPTSTRTTTTTLLQARSALTPPLRKAGSLRESHDAAAALAKRRSRLHELRAASSSGCGSGSGKGSGSEAAIAFGVSKRESKRERERRSTASAAAIRKSQSLDAADNSYSLASIQSPLWVTLTNARTIEELAQQKL